jgi:hypothetical protein
MSSAREIYRLWRDVQDAKTLLFITARDATGMTGLVDEDGCRWKIDIGYGPTPVVNVQAIAHLSDVTGVADDLH